MKTNSLHPGNNLFSYNEKKGLIKLEGRFISLNPEKLWDWIILCSDRIASNAEKIRIDLDVEYISSNDVKYLYILLKTLNNTRKPSTKLFVNWKYDTFDTEHLELGQSIKNCLSENVHFQLIEKWRKSVA